MSHWVHDVVKFAQILKFPPKIEEVFFLETKKISPERTKISILSAPQNLAFGVSKMTEITKKKLDNTINDKRNNCPPGSSLR